VKNLTLEGELELSTRLPDFVEPMNAKLVGSMRSGDWIYEIKFDGYRALALRGGSETEVLSRNKRTWAANSHIIYVCNRAHNTALHASFAQSVLDLVNSAPYSYAPISVKLPKRGEGKPEWKHRLGRGSSPVTTFPLNCGKLCKNGLLSPDLFGFADRDTLNAFCLDLSARRMPRLSEGQKLVEVAS
jgi:hypothetical protein